VVYSVNYENFDVRSRWMKLEFCNNKKERSNWILHNFQNHWNVFSFSQNPWEGLVKLLLKQKWGQDCVALHQKPVNSSCDIWISDITTFWLLLLYYSKSKKQLSKSEEHFSKIKITFLGMNNTFFYVAWEWKTRLNKQNYFSRSEKHFSRRNFSWKTWSF